MTIGRVIETTGIIGMTEEEVTGVDHHHREIVKRLIKKINLRKNMWSLFISAQENSVVV